MGLAATEYIASDNRVSGCQTEPGNYDESVEDVAGQVAEWLENEGSKDWLLGSDKPDDKNTTALGARF